MPRKPPPPSTPVVPLAVLALAIGGFVLLYYADAPLESRWQRQAALTFLPAPDHLFLMWCGGKLANLSLLDRWPIFLLASIVLATAWLTGRLALRLLSVWTIFDRLERHVFALGVGLNLMSLYALAVGLVGGLQYRLTFAAPLLVVLIANLPLSALQRSDANGISDSPPEDRRWLWLLLAALPFALVIIFGSMLPPWDYDVREYHLQTPKEWFQNGRIEFLSHNIYANMPLGSELNGVWAMGLGTCADRWWWGAMAGKTVMGRYSLIAAAGLIAFGRRLHSLPAGLIAAVLFLSTPWIVSLAVAGYNEGPVALYALLAIYSLWLAEHDVIWPLNWRFIALAGFCAGSAMACKYPPMLFLVIPLTIWLACRVGYAHHESTLKKLVGIAQPTAIFLTAVMAACGPWFAKNWALTNNPTYPLLYSAFDGHTRTPEKDRQWTRVHSPQPDDHGRRFALSGFVNQAVWFLWRTRWASMTIVPLACMAAFASPQRRFATVVCCWMLFVFTSWWLFTHRLDRFLVLLLPMAALVGGIGALAVPHGTWRNITIGFLLCGTLIQFVFVTIQPDNRYFAPLSRLRRDDTELGEIGVRVEAAHRWLNEHGKPGERVLLVGDAEPFDLEIHAVYNTCFDDCQFTRLFKDRPREERVVALHAEGIRYIFFSWSHLARYRSPGNYGYTSDYPTPALVHEELVNQQHLLKAIDIGVPLENGELFEVTP